jgi:hypothetical protein
MQLKLDRFRVIAPQAVFTCIIDFGFVLPLAAASRIHSSKVQRKLI